MRARGQARPSANRDALSKALYAGQFVVQYRARGGCSCPQTIKITPSAGPGIGVMQQRLNRPNLWLALFARVGQTRHTVHRGFVATRFEAMPPRRSPVSVSTETATQAGWTPNGGCLRRHSNQPRYATTATLNDRIRKLAQFCFTSRWRTSNGTYSAPDRAPSHSPHGL
jgi:hypothetical protein